ncbi:MAG: tRNA pseudouridine(55) synthase TruB [Planctomycetota bacterium]|nr:tRNA pseudouridine(55) synthase TruB [Planctomycetota bacterium]
MQDVPFSETLAAFNDNPLSLNWRVPGTWLLNKPSGPSSNVMVVRARKILGLQRIGHAGTLDPLASGLLLLLAGNATRLFDHMQTMTKSYIAGFRLGERRDSQDITGNIDETFAPTARPPFAAESLAAALDRFRGDIQQTPPMHSALKKDGQPLYKLARKGVSVEREPRSATVHRLAVLDFDGTSGMLAMTVSKGFYVRTLIDDLGLLLGCGAVMTSLVRSAIGPYRVEEAVDLDGLAGKIAEA